MLRFVFRRLVAFPLWPVLSGVLIGVCLADLLGLSSWLPVLAGGLITTAIVRKRWLVMLSGGLIAAYLTHGFTISHQRSSMLAFEHQSVIYKTSIEGVIIDAGKKDTGPYLVKIIKSNELSSGSRVLLSQPRRQSTNLEYGDVIKAEGKLSKIGAIRNPYGFDRAEWLHRRGANLEFTPNRPVNIQGVSWLHIPVRTMAKWRGHIRNAITHGISAESKQAQLIRAVVLGERPPRKSAMIQDFRESGTLHVFAVSGLHVGMVGIIIAAVLWLIHVPRWMMVSGVILGMTIYAGVTGMNPPAVRAVVMAAVFLTGFLMQRKPALVNSLAASAIIVLLIDGHQLFTPGFQLSYGVLLAIALATTMWTRVLKPLGEIDPFFPRSLLSSKQEFVLEKRRWLRGSLAVSASAWMGSAPLMWIHFGIVTPIAIIAGIPLMLIVFLILALAMLSLAVGAIWQPAGEAVNALNSYFASASYTMAATFAETPGGHFYSTPHDDGRHRIIVFDLPYGGGAQFLDMGGGILLDSGRDDAFHRHVMPTLTALRSQPDSLIISHADSKHSGAMSQCLGYYKIKQALIPRRDLRSPSYKQFLTNAAKHDCRLIVPKMGQVFQIEPGVHLEILHAPALLDGLGRADDTGLVLRLHCQGWRILFTGDAGYTTEERLLDSGVDLHADVVVMGRNRDDFTGSQRFLEAVHPRVIISTNAPFPNNETIPKVWKKLLKENGIQLLDQHQTGAVTITSDNDSLTLEPTLKAARSLTLTRE
ncbi:MAG: ComEC/Rec2 family competence protein [Akkermansiaceae bacterium]